MVELLQVGDVLQLCSVVRGGGLRTQGMGVVDLLLEATMAVVKLTAFRCQNIHLLVLKNILKVQDLPHLLEVPSSLGLVFERLDVVPPELLFDCLVHIRVDLQHREVDGLTFRRRVFDNVAVHHFDMGLALPSQTEPFLGIRPICQNQLACFSLAESLNFRPSMDLRLEDIPSLLYLLHPLCFFDLGCSGNQIIHFRVIHQLLKLILIQLQHNAFRAHYFSILHPFSFEYDLLLSEVTLLADGLSIDHERSRQRLCLELILALLNN